MKHASAVMEGFDPKWTSPDHYILGITKQIWEDRDIASLDGYYARRRNGYADQRNGAKPETSESVKESG